MADPLDITPERLLRAADTILNAATPSGLGCVPMALSDAKANPYLFTERELLAAMRFLQRMGLAETMKKSLKGGTQP